MGEGVAKQRGKGVKTLWEAKTVQEVLDAPDFWLTVSLLPTEFSRAIKAAMAEECKRVLAERKGKGR